MHNFPPQWAEARKLVVGMLHLMPLPGSPRFGGSPDRIRDRLLRDAEALAQGCVHGMMMENFGDVPFYPGRAPAYVIALMTELACEVRRRFPEIPLGINVLRNDGQSALAIAAATGASFIRVNVLCGARVADQGILQGIAHELLRERALLGAEVAIMADVDVKHSAPLAQRSLRDEVDDTIERGLADAVIVSGSGTGKITEVEKVRMIKQHAGQWPVFVGSGVSARTIEAYLEHADGFIVGTSIKQDGVDTPVDPRSVRELMSWVL